MRKMFFIHVLGVSVFITATCVFAFELPVNQSVSPANFHVNKSYQFGQEAIEIEQVDLDLDVIPIEAQGLKRFDFRYMNFIDTSA